jgi:hypothetical protein
MIFQALEEINCQPRLIHPENLSFRIEEWKLPKINSNYRNSWALNEHCRRSLKESYTKDKNIHTIKKIWGRINPTRWVDEKFGIGKK